MRNRKMQVGFHCVEGCQGAQKGEKQECKEASILFRGDQILNRKEALRWETEKCMVASIVSRGASTARVF